jgi:hypothetical protein
MVESEVENPVEIEEIFDCPIEGLKYGIGEPVSETK